MQIYCMIFMKSIVSGSLHLLNKIPNEWSCKKQNTVESATYGSELVAACIATDQSIYLRYHCVICV